MDFETRDFGTRGDLPELSLPVAAVGRDLRLR